MKSTLWRSLLLVALLAFSGITVVHGTVNVRINRAFVQVRIVNNAIHLEIIKDGPEMENVLLTRLPGDESVSLSLDTNCGTDNICVRNNNETYAVIHAAPNADVIKISRHVHDPEAELIDCYELGENRQWYGGPQLRHQHWPIQNMYYEEEPCVPTHPQNMAVCERYWLSSIGVYILVNETDPLFLDQNNYKAGAICLVAKNKAPYRTREVVTLNYEIGVFGDPRIAHKYVVKNHFGSPEHFPNTRMIRHPIWSTWARYKANVSEEVVEEFADEILSNNFKNSQLEIDDNWETCYGSAEFDKEKFPNIKALTNRLKKKGFRVTLWIHPFINEGCEPAYSTALKNSYFVKSMDGRVRMSWWQGAEAATIDFTNPKAVEWWVARLKRLQAAGIDSFKFDAGEVSWLPEIASLNGPLDKQPGIFTSDYVNTLAKNFDDSIEVRVGWRSQKLSIFVRMIDKDTRWTWNNGLPTLITTLLQMSLNGYNYVLPDMVGGNGYLNNMLNATIYPSKELFIRWLQATVFMPSIQYSFVPWDYDNETIDICRRYTDLHAQFTSRILQEMSMCITTGAPVNPPIWWIDPGNEIAHKIYDEYLLGEDILVAPVIEEGAVSRNIYLPRGLWLNPYKNWTIFGPGWLHNFSAPLDMLPYFIRKRP